MKKILVIEDDQDIADLIELVFEGTYLVETKTDNEGISQKVKSFNPDLIMLDNQLGQKQAIDVLAELKAFNVEGNIPIVLCSGNQDIDRIGEDINAVACLAKPFGLNELKDCVNEILG